MMTKSEDIKARLRNIKTIEVSLEDYNSKSKAVAALATLHAAVAGVRDDAKDARSKARLSGCNIPDHVFEAMNNVVDDLDRALDAAPAPQGAPCPECGNAPCTCPVHPGCDDCEDVICDDCPPPKTAICYRNPTFDDSEDFMESIMDAVSTGPKLISKSKRGDIWIEPPPAPVVGIDPAEVADVTRRMLAQLEAKKPYLSTIGRAAVNRWMGDLDALIAAAGDPVPSVPKEWLDNSQGKVERQRENIKELTVKYKAAKGTIKALNQQMLVFTERLKMQPQEPCVPVSEMEDVAKKILQGHNKNRGHDETRFGDGCMAGYGQSYIYLMDALAPHRRAPSPADKPARQMRGDKHEILKPGSVRGWFPCPACTEPAAPEPELIESNQAKCPKCGCANHNIRTKCRECGLELSFGTDAPAAPDPPPCSTEERAAWIAYRLYPVNNRKTCNDALSVALVLSGQNDTEVRAWLADKE